MSYTIRTKLRRVTPTELYKMQIQGVTEALRAQYSGKTYIPPQLGGINGQRSFIQSAEVMEVSEFEG